MKRSAWLGAVVLAVGLGGLSSAQQTPGPQAIDVRTLMSAAEWNAAGLAKLSPTELEALNAWVVKWSNVVDQRARAAAQAPAPPADYQNGGQSKVHWIADVQSGGRLVALEDGSCWEIEPGHQKLSRDWTLKQEIVAWKLSGSDLDRHRDFPYKLQNKAQGKWVYAKFLGMR
jgi:hypothetical protein